MTCFMISSPKRSNFARLLGDKSGSPPLCQSPRQSHGRLKMSGQMASSPAPRVLSTSRCGRCHRPDQGAADHPFANRVRALDVAMHKMRPYPSASDPPPTWWWLGERRGARAATLKVRPARCLRWPYVGTRNSPRSQPSVSRDFIGSTSSTTRR